MPRWALLRRMHSGDQHPIPQVQLFVERIAESEQVWALRDAEGSFALYPSIDDENIDVALFWSDKASALVHRREEWSDFQAVSISLQDFVDNWLRGLHFDGILVGPDWGAGLEGPELEAEELAKLITQ